MEKGLFAARLVMPGKQENESWGRAGKEIKVKACTP